MAPPRCGGTFLNAVVDVDGGDWLDRHPTAAAVAAQSATAAAVMTKRSKNRDCRLKNCLGGQETGRSQNSVQCRGPNAILRALAATHRIHTRSASFLA